MDRPLTANFLQDEYNIQLDGYKQILKTNCDVLLNKGEALYKGRIINISSKEIFIKFRAQRGLPRINSGNYICYLLLKEDRKAETVKKICFNELIKKAQYSFEFKPSVYLPDKNDKDFTIGIFTSFEVDVPEKISSYINSIVYIGIEPPPLQMLMNLKNYVQSNKENLFLDADYDKFHNGIVNPVKGNAFEFINKKIALVDSPIVQGPPGSGKSFLIANLVSRLCCDNKSVLVISLTNQALTEIAKKEPLKNLISAERVFKTAVTVSELSQVKGLKTLPEVGPQKGCLHLATCFRASFAVIDDFVNKYDYVFVDEASECTLPMLSMVFELGNKHAFFGDQCQLPPVVELNNDVIVNRNYSRIVNGLNSISLILKTYQLLQTYRLPEYSAECTSRFYKYPVLSMSENTQILNLKLGGKSLSIPQGTFIFFIKMDNSKAPKEAIDLVCKIAAQLVEKDRQTDITLLSYLKITMKETYKAIIHNSTTAGGKILIETVHRIQGLTTDYAIYTFPKYLNHKLNSNLINVATSRGTKGNFIIMDRESIEVIRSKYAGNSICNFFNCILEQEMYIDL